MLKYRIKPSLFNLFLVNKSRNYSDFINSVSHFSLLEETLSLFLASELRSVVHGAGPQQK